MGARKEESVWESERGVSALRRVSVLLRRLENDDTGRLLGCTGGRSGPGTPR